MPIVYINDEYILLYSDYYYIVLIIDVCIEYSKCDSKGPYEDYTYLSKMT